MRVSVSENFKIWRWIGFLFLQNQKFDGGEDSQQDSAERAFNSHNLCSTKWRRSSDSAAVSKRCMLTKLRYSREDAGGIIEDLDFDWGATCRRLPASPATEPRQVLPFRRSGSPTD